MWKATRKVAHKKPAEWLRKETTQELIETLQAFEKGGISRLLEIKKGRNGGTSAHWQLAVAYAAFFDPHFQLWIGNAFLLVPETPPMNHKLSFLVPRKTLKTHNAPFL